MAENATSIYISRYYIANSSFETIMYGSDLENGMFVVFGEMILRGDPEQMANEYDKYRALEMNRWCEISQIKKSLEHVWFIGLYSDGTMMKRGGYAKDYCWIVKKDSITAK